MFNFLPFYTAVFIVNAFLVVAQVSDKRLCGNEDCSVVIGEGRTILHYPSNSNDPRLLSFRSNEVVKIYSKHAGSNPVLWGVEINGRRGYVSKNMMREFKTLKSPTVLVDVEPLVKVPSEDKRPQLDVTKAYTVIDGTTIYDDPDISPSSTESMVQPSAVPALQHANPQQTETIPLPATTYHPETVKEEPLLLQKESAANNSPEPIGLSEQSIKENADLSDKKEMGSTIEAASQTDKQNAQETPKTQSDDATEDDDGEADVGTEDDENGERDQEPAESSEGEETESEEKEEPKALMSDEQGSTQTSNGEQTKVEQKKQHTPSNEQGSTQTSNGEETKVEQKEQHTPSNQQGSTQKSNGAETKVEQKEQQTPSSKEEKEPMRSSKEGDEQNGEKPTPSTEEEALESEQKDLVPTSAEGGIESVQKEAAPSESMQSEQKEEKPIPSTNEESEQKEDPIPVIAEPGKRTEQQETPVPIPESEPVSVKDPSLVVDEVESRVESKIEESQQGNQDLIDQNSTEEKLEVLNMAKVENTTDPISRPEGAVAAQTEEHEEFLEQPPSESSEIPNKEEQNVIILPSQNVTTEPEMQSGSSFVDSSADELAAVSDNADKGGERTPLFPYLKHSEDYLPMSNNLGLDDGADRSSVYKEQMNDSPAAQDIDAEREIEEDVKTVEEMEVESSNQDEVETHSHDFSYLLSRQSEDSCTADCKLEENLDSSKSKGYTLELPIISYKILIVLVITAVTVVVFLWGYAYIDKRRREGILIGKINHLQKQFLIIQKENELLTNKLADIESEFDEKSNQVSSEALANLEAELEEERQSRSTLEAQVKVLEKELENSTEVGLELNRMLSQFLSSENGSDTLVANIEQLQRQIIEQQDLINNYNDNLNVKETENHELRLEVDINNTKVTELQSELNKMALSLLKLEEDKDTSQTMHENELENLKEELAKRQSQLTKETNKFNEQIKDLTSKYEEVKRNFELKSNEYRLLKENVSQIKKLDNNMDGVKSLLNVTAIQAELLQLRSDKQLLMEELQVQSNKCSMLESRYETVLQDYSSFKEKYDVADREKVEAVTKLEVLDKYFKEREAQLQKELTKQESMWVEKQGEATSTIERIKYMQEELQNYKAQNESLKQEILEQEVQMKSQISVLEKKAHENWVAARQSERKLDDAKQEAAMLRNRLTLQERTLNEEKMHNRIQSPIEHNGEIQGTQTHIGNDTAPSPSLLFGGHENLTISPPLPGLPFLPPPPGVPFMPPPLGGVPLPPPAFMPPPPSLLPGDHRLPPLGRISSPPLNPRFQHDRAYSPYNRNSPSPTSDDDYDRMPIPPMYGGYNSYNRDDRRDDNRRDLHRPPPPMMNNIRNSKGHGHSSGSANSTESLEKINRHNSRV